MKRKKIFVWLSAACILFTAGCSKKTEQIKNIGTETQTKAVQMAEREDEFAQFRDAAAWNEDIQGTYQGDKVDISIFASVDPPECKQSVVVEGKVCDFTQEYKEMVLKGIAGGADIYYYDIAHRTTKELESMLNYFEAVLETYERTGEFTPRGNSRHLPWEWDDSWKEEDWMTRQEMEDAVKDIPKYLETSSNTYTKADVFSSDEYIIERNGGWCRIYFLREENGTRTIYMVSDRDNGPDGIWKDATLISVFTSHEEGENECKFSTKEAEQEAVSYLQKIGMDGLVPTETKNLLSSPSGFKEPEPDIEDPVWGDVLYGYKITLGAGIGGESMFGTMEEEGFVGKACVMDDGVLSFYMNNPVEQTRVSEHVALLSLSKIKTAFKKELSQNLDHYSKDQRKKFKFDSLKLVYLWQMKDESTGEGAYIPVWVLKDTSMDQQVRIYVNAIDGTVLDEGSLK